MIPLLVIDFKIFLEHISPGMEDSMVKQRERQNHWLATLAVAGIVVVNPTNKSYLLFFTVPKMDILQV